MEKGLTLRGGQVFVQKYWKRLYEIIRSGDFDPTFVITNEFPLEQTPEAYDLFDKKRDGVIKVILKTQFGFEKATEFHKRETKQREEVDVEEMMGSVKERLDLAEIPPVKEE